MQLVGFSAVLYRRFTNDKEPAFKTASGHHTFSRSSETREIRFFFTSFNDCISKAFSCLMAKKNQVGNLSNNISANMKNVIVEYYRRMHERFFFPSMKLQKLPCAFSFWGITYLLHYSWNLSSNTSANMKSMKVEYCKRMHESFILPSIKLQKLPNPFSFWGITDSLY